MNSLRPLITITILAVVGGWLYLQINKGPKHVDDAEAPAWQGHAADSVPPLAVTTTNPAPMAAGPAPKWPDAASTAPPVATTVQPAATALQPATTESNSNGLPAIPAIPELPDAPKPSQTTPPISTADAAPVTPPANIPTARYPDAVDAAATGAAVAPTTQTQLPPANPVVPDATVGSSPVTTPQSTEDHENSIATDNAMAAAGFTPQMRSSTPVASDATPPAAPQAQQQAPGADRYGLGATNVAAPTQPTTPLEPPMVSAQPVEQRFAAAWPEVQAALDHGELARAHQLLTKWYGDDSLTLAEAEKVDALLGQLAGTVVYSNEHQLEPAYVVQPGQNLEAVAKGFNVPWQLLAKINGVPTVDAVQPGQKLKVIRGPFSAVVDLRRSQLALFVDGRYAGKFPITLPTDAAVSEGKWVVEQKLTFPGGNSYYSSPASNEVAHTIVLKSEDVATGKPVASGPEIAIAGSDTAIKSSSNSAAIRISPQDAAELSDILSVGSRVTIRK